MKADKRGKVKGCKMNSIVAGIDLVDRESLATVLSPIGDVADRFSFPMNEEGYTYFASRVPKDARIAFESTIRVNQFRGHSRCVGTMTSLWLILRRLRGS